MSKQQARNRGIKLKGIDLLLTYRCTGQCKMCTYGCSPQTRVQMEEELALSALACAAAHPLKWVLLFGGEPFLAYDLLLRVTRSAVRLTTAPVFIFTNASFAASPDRARELLEPLAGAGLFGLYLSIDVYHADHVPPARVATAALAAAGLGLNVAVEAKLPPWADRDRAEKLETSRLVEEFESATGIPVKAEPYRLTGRAAEQDLYGPSEDLSRCQLPSYLGEELLSPHGIEVHPGGDICLCSGLSLGNLKQRSLEDILAAYDSFRHPVIGPLLEGGPMALLKAAAGRGLLDSSLLKTPMSRCQACHLARKALLPKFPAELSPRQCYGA